MVTTAPRWALPLLAAAAALALLRLGRGFFVPLAASVTLAALLYPLVQRLARVLHSRVLAALLAVGVAVATVLGVGYAVVSQLGVTVERAPTVLRLAARDIARLAEPSTAGTMKHTRAALAELDRSVAKVTGDVPAAAAPPPRKSSLVADAAEWLRTYVVASTLSTLGVLLQAGVIALMTFFLLCSGDLLLRRLKGWLHPERGLSLHEATKELGRQVRLYGGVLMLTNLVLGLGVWGGFTLLGVPDAWAWGLVAMVLHFVPYAGLALLMLLAAFEVYALQASLVMALVAAGFVGVLGIVVGTAMTAWLQARAARVDGATLFVGTVFWSVWWGGWGLLLGPVLVVAALAAREWVSAARSADLQQAPVNP